MRQIQEELKRLNKLHHRRLQRLAARCRAGLRRRPSRSTCARCCDGVFEVFEDVLSGDTREGRLGDRPRCRKIPHAFVVRGHEARLGRVVTNLLDNALSFSPENGVVKVVARRVGAEVELVVEDEGPGIPSDKVEDIFKRFYSDRPQTDRTVGKNSGLGLSISREIVQAYGGRIWAEQSARSRRAARRLRSTSRSSCANGASTVLSARGFTVRLPAADAAPSREHRRLPDAAELVHGTCVALGRVGRVAARALGIRQVGPCSPLPVPGSPRPGCPEPPTLVADDQVRVRQEGARLLVKAPPTMRGKLEVRGVGIVDMKTVADAELVLVV